MSKEDEEKTTKNQLMQGSFCKLKPHACSSKSSENVENGASLLMLIVGANVTLVSDVGTACSVEESLEESTSLSRENNEYMDVRSFMQNVRGGPSGITIGEGSTNSRKRKRTTFGIGNIILSSKDKST
ncbi:hypothetical protein J1N35_034078 [Gossypium stocksii]|uniref:Uncharacterized protein n=1 Tax=Gossypium stocksii TaxID=47602 RepID=A0A9D3URA0_9ROSI|nr:hypothetical protein J1N35_034078 [Gossypium stocksii]